MKPRVCSQCCAPLRQPRVGRPRRFCSAKCANADRSAKMTAARLAERASWHCIACDALIPGMARWKYCSAECAAKSRAKPARHCIDCGAVVTARSVRCVPCRERVYALRLEVWALTTSVRRLRAQIGKEALRESR